MKHAWKAVGAIDPKQLAAERLQLHHAARVLASTAHALLVHQDDDSHSNLGFDRDTSSLVTHQLTADKPLKLCLSLPDLALSFRESGDERASLELARKTMADAYAWASEFLGSEVPQREFPDFPESELSRGEAFRPGDRPARVELAVWYGNALSAMEELAATESSLSPIRVWPHHFDLGALITPAAGKSIGLGLSPGDRSYDEPYHYVSPYPPPATLPDWDGPGHWHTEGFVSAVMTASELLRAGGDQREAVGEYLHQSIDRCRRLLG